MLVAVLGLAAAYLLAGTADARGVVYLLTSWSATAFAWLGVRRCGPSKVSVSLAVALTASSLGDAAWGYVSVTAGDGAVPTASLADLFYGPSYVALGVALLLLVARRDGRRWDPQALIDALTIVTVSVLLVWTVSVEKLVHDSSSSIAVRLMWAAYPVAGAIIFTLALRALVSRANHTLPALAMLGGIVCWVASDATLVFLDMQSRREPALEIAWMVGAVLVSFGPWAPRTSGATEDATWTTSTTDLGLRLRMLIAILPLVVPSALEVVDDVRNGESTSYVALAGLLLLLALAFARTSRLLRSEQTLRAQVRASERRAAALAANSSDALVVSDEAGGILRDSRQLPQLVNRPINGAVELSALITPPEREQLGRTMQHVLAHPDEVATSEFSVIGEDDKARWVSARLVNLLSDPDVGGVVFALSDVTARKEMEQELERSRDAALDASRAKSAFLANMSHEIRTPMNGVIGLTELMLTTRLDGRQRQYAEGIRTAGDALLTVINDILDFSKVEAGQLELETIDFDLASVVEETGELVAKDAGRKGLELLAYCSPDVPPGVRGDPARLRQVLLNLAANAVKFTERGEVVISVHHVDGGGDAHLGAMLEFEVRDTGIGLDEADADRLFAPFSQADSSTTRRFGGTGLGLAISAQLVEAMGGTIGVRSQEGRGSTFWFRVPLALAHDSTTPRRPATQLSGVRALVVDDNPTNRLILSEQLTAWGMGADTATGADEAFDLMREAAAAGRPYELALIDYCMPQVNGLSLARRVSEDPSLSATAMLLLTSLDSVDPADATAAGISAVLTKPVRMGQLLAAVEQRIAVREQVHLAAPEVASPALTRGRVLVVEDNEINQLVAVGILEHLGFSAEVASDGAQAMVAMERGRFAAVLMDCQMPVMDGFQATAQIRRMEGVARHTPIIAMTAGAVEGDREKCLAAGMDDYVAKPVSPDEVEAALLRWVPARAA